MGLAITSNPCPTEHGPMGFPTVTHRVAYLGTRQPAVGTREVGNLASECTQDSPEARISDFIKAITTLERSPAKAQANGSYKWPGPDISMALCTCHVLMGTRKDQFDATEVDIPKLTDAVAMKKPLAILAQICRARDVAVFHKSQLKVLFAAIESIELDTARAYNHCVVPLEARLVVAYIIGYKIYDLVLRQLEVIKNRSQFADAATTSKATDDLVSDVLGQSAPAPSNTS